jgi:hypothetical protein
VVDNSVLKSPQIQYYIANVYRQLFSKQHARYNELLIKLSKPELFLFSALCYVFRLCLSLRQANVFRYKVVIDLQCQLSCIYCETQTLQLARIILKCIVKFKCKRYCSKILINISLSFMPPFGSLLHSVFYCVCCPTDMFIISRCVVS